MFIRRVELDVMAFDATILVLITQNLNESREGIFISPGCCSRCPGSCPENVPGEKEILSGSKLEENAYKLAALSCRKPLAEQHLQN